MTRTFDDDALSAAIARIDRSRPAPAFRREAPVEVAPDEIPFRNVICYVQEGLARYEDDVRALLGMIGASQVHAGARFGFYVLSFGAHGELRPRDWMGCSGTFALDDAMAMVGKAAIAGPLAPGVIPSLFVPGPRVSKRRVEAGDLLLFLCAGRDVVAADAAAETYAARARQALWLFFGEQGGIECGLDPGRGSSS